MTAPQNGAYPMVLPTYGMPCCGHRIVQHEPDDVTGSAGCRCCETGRVPTSALVLMADEPPVNAFEQQSGRFMCCTEPTTGLHRPGCPRSSASDDYTPGGAA